MDYKALGERIKKQRLRINLTQEKLAERIQISEAYLGHVERGDRKLSVETLVKIANELNLSTDYLLMGAIKTEPIEFVNKLLLNLDMKNEKQKQNFMSIVELLATNIEKWTK